jgi:prepilin peptidase CpaA
MDAGRTAIGVCFAIVAISAIWDLVSLHIPNVLTLGGVALGVALRIALGYTDAGTAGALKGLAWATAGIFLCGVLPMMSYRAGDIGGADVKLFIAIGALCGPFLGFNVQAWTYGVIVLAVSPIQILLSGDARGSLVRAKTRLANIFRPAAEKVLVASPPRKHLPMAPPMFVGMCAAFTFHGVFR